jgi:hypothetical protein
MLGSFPLLYIIPEIINIKREKFVLAYSFGGFSPWSVGSNVFGPVVSLNIMAGADCETKLLKSWSLRRK